MDQVGATYDNGQPAYWIEAGTGKPYTYLMVNGQNTGRKNYLPLNAIQPYADDPTKPQGSGFLHGHAQWDSERGEWHQPINGGNLLALGVGSAMAAPFVGPALAHVFAGAPGAAGPAAETLAPESTAAAGATEAALPAGAAAAGPAAAAAGSSSVVPATTAAAHTILGIPTGDLVLGGADILAKSLASAFAPSPYQPRQSYRGTSADPVAYMTDLKTKLDDIFQQATTHLHAGTAGTADLSKAQPQPISPGPFSGGSGTPQRRSFSMPGGDGGMTPPQGGGGGTGQGQAAAQLLLHALGGG